MPTDFIEIGTPLDQSEISSNLSFSDSQAAPSSPSRRRIESDTQHDISFRSPSKDRVLILTDTGRPVYDDSKTEDCSSLCSALATIFHRLLPPVSGASLTLASGHLTVVFLDRRPLILVAITEKKQKYLAQIVLAQTHRILLSLLTGSFERTLRHRPNFDLRTLLTGAEKSLGRAKCLHPSDVDSVQVLPLNQTVRRAVTAVLSDRLPDAVLAGMLLLVDSTDARKTHEPDRVRLVAAVGGSGAARLSFEAADLNALFVTVANNRSLATGEHWIPFCFPGVDRDALAQVYVKRLVPRPVTETVAAAELFVVFVSPDPNSFHQISAHAKLAEENVSSTGAYDLILRAYSTPFALPQGVLDVKVALQGGQAFSACSTETELEPAHCWPEIWANGYAEMQESLASCSLPRQLFRTLRLEPSSEYVHQMVWRTSDFEMHLTLQGHVPEGKALEVYAYIKDHELKIFIPLRIPLKPWHSTPDGRVQTQNSFLRRLAGFLG